MTISTRDLISLSQARATQPQLAEQEKGDEERLTKSGESYVALSDAQGLSHYHQLERERIYLLLIDEASRGLVDVEAGNVKDARVALGMTTKTGK